MKNFREYLLILLFPLLYVLADIIFRYNYLIHYSGTRKLFYFLSIFITVSVFILTIILMIKNENRKFFTNSLNIIVSMYYSTTILSSYLFVFHTGIFPNFYTLTYLKNEPANALSLVKDSIHSWQVVVFLLFFISFFLYLQRLSGLEAFKKISSNIKPGLLSLIIISLLVIQVKYIRKCDQSMIVDVNFTVDICRHIIDWNASKSYTGEGLPSRDPVALKKIRQKPDFNILLIVFESLRTQNMQIYGYERETTPFLNSLNRSEPRSLYIFRKTYSVSTTTMLAIPAILTGVTPEQPGVFYKTMPFVWEYAEMMNYHTFFISSHSMYWYRFDRYYSLNKPVFFWNKDTSGLPSFNDIGIDDRLTVQMLNSHIQEIRHKPFFGVLQFNATHFPYNVPAEHVKWNKKYIDKYDNSVLYQDFLLEKVFSGLKNNNLLKSTIVIMISDHGEAFKEHNTIGHIDNYNTETVSIPLIMYIPPGISSKLNTSQLMLNTQLNTSNADITPTILNLLKLRNNKEVSSIYPVFTGKNLFEVFDPYRNIITLNNNDITNFNAGLSLIKGSHHYILKTNVVPYARELYDINTDPGEKNNLITTADREWLKSMNSILRENSCCRKILNLYED